MRELRLMQFVLYSVLVPGGQQIYTRPDGAVGYTQAHSAYIPSGSYIDGYTNTTIYCGGPKTLLNFKAYDCEIGEWPKWDVMIRMLDIRLTETHL
jgi:hypothetical protein